MRLMGCQVFLHAILVNLDLEESRKTRTTKDVDAPRRDCELKHRTQE